MLSVKQKRLQNPGDVWERIRSGMQIPRPSPGQTIPDQALEKNNSALESSVIQTRLGLQSGANNAQIPASIQRYLSLKKLDQNEYSLFKNSGAR